MLSHPPHVSHSAPMRWACMTITQDTSATALTARAYLIQHMWTCRAAVMVLKHDAGAGESKHGHVYGPPPSKEGGRVISLSQAVRSYGHARIFHAHTARGTSPRHTCSARADLAGRADAAAALAVDTRSHSALCKWIGNAWRGGGQWH